MFQKKVHENGYVYKIVSNNTDKFYIGSTTNSLARCLKEHELAFLSGEYAKASYEILQNYHYEIELLEAFVFVTKEELKIKEDQYKVKYLKNCINPITSKYSKVKKRENTNTKTVEEFLQNEAKARYNIDKQMSESVDTIFKKEIKEMQKKANKCKDNIAIIGLLKTIDRCF
jgi:hypothetical protein